ncbi:hypothetical protein [Enterococcus casseliflavus]|uniref:hypothetical protein n=1 Tax=Enterococcus casseliflavus TaxID=37734 RepID=UPI00115F441A|nr:hypothetical protein [Enterococcus casseliflavus]MBE6168969.1 hypothetical protein [Enterococcus casseliflavus]
MGVVWTAVDKIHKKQRFFYWAEWGEERTAGIHQMTFLKMILPLGIYYAKNSSNKRTAVDRMKEELI